MPSSSPFLHTLPMFTIASPFLSFSTQNPEKSDFVIFPLDKSLVVWYNCSCACGRGGIGIRARLRGVSSNGYGFKSRRPHQNLLSFARKVFLCALFLPEHQIFLHSHDFPRPSVFPLLRYKSTNSSVHPKGSRGQSQTSSVSIAPLSPPQRHSPCNKKNQAAKAQKADCPAHSRMGSGIAHAISALSSPVCGARYTCSGYASSCENT